MSDALSALVVADEVRSLTSNKIMVGKPDEIKSVAEATTENIKSVAQSTTEGIKNVADKSITSMKDAAASVSECFKTDNTSSPSEHLIPFIFGVFAGGVIFYAGWTAYHYYSDERMLKRILCSVQDEKMPPLDDLEKCYNYLGGKCLSVIDLKKRILSANSEKFSEKDIDRLFLSAGIDIEALEDSNHDEKMDISFDKFVKLFSIRFENHKA